MEIVYKSDNGRHYTTSKEAMEADNRFQASKKADAIKSKMASLTCEDMLLNGSFTRQEALGNSSMFRTIFIALSESTIDSLLGYRSEIKQLDI